MKIIDCFEFVNSLGESAGLRAALAGENAQKQKHYLLHGALYRFQGGKREGRGKRAREEGNESADRHIGQEALDKLEGLKYEEDYEDDGYVLSSADALRDPLPTGQLSHLERATVNLDLSE